MVYLYAIQIVENQYDDEIASLLTKISEERRRKTKKYARRIDQRRCIVGEILLRYILWKHYGITSKEIVFQYNEYGKPLLIKPKGIHFNISHSGEWVLCGVSDMPIGIDVEGRMVEVVAIAERFFSEDENRYINSHLLCDKYDAFYKIWTLKESYIKCVGMGLQIPLDSFSFVFLKEQINMFVDGRLDNKYIFKSKKISDRYHMALCILGKTCNLWENDIKNISVEDLMSSSTYF
ncbi:phosphopantetheinyl transferase [Clostridium putrefaciens]|uniref:Phosphopantetheinyl transferase n=1 Tax=Clostridium putrefaciens TaxID=99675 RepID=A0A381J9U8_9CLOT|nr:4'-phosphopantetheinyl transferase superfamily protein [Clostridium putrefaciens]SUY47142.1 phosphopantetheinyl transferase [Clostridium putrefaciens]